MKPVIVQVVYSEAGGLLQEGAVMEFLEFELEAGKAADAHKTGGYLKTKVIVTFDSGETYECRLDLNPISERGFKHGIETRIAHYHSGRGQEQLENMSAKHREDWENLHDIWLTMDFTQTPDWFWWEAGDLKSPVDYTFCTCGTF